VKIGGKTGTAQVVSKNRALSGERFQDHAWFVAVAPVEQPEVAVSVFMEHGMHGSAAAPIAKKAIEAYFLNKKKGSRVLNGQQQAPRNAETDGEEVEEEEEE
jgi:penicillin-binding protein 2